MQILHYILLKIFHYVFNEKRFVDDRVADRRMHLLGILNAASSRTYAGSIELHFMDDDDDECPHSRLSVPASASSSLEITSCDRYTYTRAKSNKYFRKAISSNFSRLKQFSYLNIEIRSNSGAGEYRADTELSVVNDRARFDKLGDDENLPFESRSQPPSRVGKKRNERDEVGKCERNANRPS